MTNKTIKSTVLLVAIKFIERGIGIISTLILARILTPEDFGLVAIILLAISFFESITSAGTEQYIIQKVNVTQIDLNTAWTLDLILKSFIAVILIIVSSYIADFYQNPSITLPMQCMSVLLILNAAINPEIHLLKKANEYKKIFILSVIQKVIMAIATIGIALYFRSFWALIAGHLFHVITFLVGSYVICKSKPSFSLKALGQQVNFSSWVLTKSIFGYFRSVLDTIMVGKIYDISALGAYHNMKYLSAMPYTQLIEPAAAPLLATFSSEKASHEKTQYFFTVSLFMVLSFSLPLCMFSILFSSEIVFLLLGEQWLEYSSLFGVLSIFIVSMSVGAICNALCLSRGLVKWLFIYDFLGFLIVVITIYFTIGLSIEVFALLRAIVGVATALLFLVVVSKRLYLSLIETIISLFKIGLLILICVSFDYLLTNVANNEGIIFSLLRMSCFLFVYFLLFAFLVWVDNSNGTKYIRIKVEGMMGHKKAESL